MGRVRHRLTYANVMATVAVFIALGGSSYAVIAPPANSVGPRELKRGAVTPPKLSGATLALIGRPGPAARAAATSVRYREVDSTVQAGATDFGDLTCTRRYHPVSGYFGSDETGVEQQGQLVLTDSHPFSSHGKIGWDIGIKNLDSNPHKWFAGVVCAR